MQVTPNYIHLQRGLMFLKALSAPRTDVVPTHPRSPRASKQLKTHEGVTPGGGSAAPSAAPSPLTGGFSGFTGLSKPSFTPPPGSGAGGRTPPASASGTPVSQLAVASERKAVHMMEQLHPYDDQWTIKVGGSGRGGGRRKGGG